LKRIEIHINRTTSCIKYKKTGASNPGESSSFGKYCAYWYSAARYYVSDRIVNELKNIQTISKINYGKLDITFYRDDVRKELKIANQTDIPFSIENKNVVIIDDVLWTGRTTRAALDALLDFGRPAKVELCVLIDRRFSRELPITADYVGRTIDTFPSQKVKVYWKEKDERDEVVLI
jgi:pyrimidine operon attenuation protein/uracil phosphoribosyltransferase